MTKDNALSYVGPIMTAYNAAEKAGASALSFALECGKQLNGAMKTVEAASPKRTWKSWCEANLQVSEETERLYRRLAYAVAQDEDFFAKCESIRDAMKHLAKYENKDGILVLKPEKKKPPAQQVSGNGVTGLQPPETDTPSTDPATRGAEAMIDLTAAADARVPYIVARRLASQGLPVFPVRARQPLTARGAVGTLGILGTLYF